MLVVYDNCTCNIFTRPAFDVCKYSCLNKVFFKVTVSCVHFLNKRGLDATTLLFHIHWWTFALNGKTSNLLTGFNIMHQNTGTAKTKTWILAYTYKIDKQREWTCIMLIVPCAELIKYFNCRRDGYFRICESNVILLQNKRLSNKGTQYFLK